MLIRLASDIHLDFDALAWERLPKKARPAQLDFIWSPKELPTDSQTVLLLPGDIWIGHRSFERRFGGDESWIERVAKRFKAVICLPGNHDYWDAELDSWVEKAQALVAEYGAKNIYVLENQSVIIDDVKFLGGTLWTDYDKKSPLVVTKAGELTNDFKFIRRKVGMVYRRLWVKDILAKHDQTREFILKSSRRDYPEQKVVVLSHHAPSSLSIAEDFKNDGDLVFAYYSELGWELCDPEVQVDLWVHGHTHNCFDYQLDRTRVLCNPRGYVGNEVNSFDETLLIEL